MATRQKDKIKLSLNTYLNDSPRRYNDVEQASGGGWQKLYTAPDWFRHTTCNTRRHMTLNTNMTWKAAKSTRFDTLTAVTVNITMLCDLTTCYGNKHYTRTTGTGWSHLQDG
jgi:hypothetical protein